MLTGAVARIADARVDDVTVFPEGAAVDVTFTLAGDTYRETLAHDRDEADDDRVLTRGLAGTPAVTALPADPVPFAVSGVRADDDPALCRDGRSGPDGEHPLLPAVYDVSVDLRAGRSTRHGTGRPSRRCASSRAVTRSCASSSSRPAGDAPARPYR